jgi:FkbM family methyltransferase
LQGIIDRYKLLNKKSTTLSYIDLGAWRPIRGSNTYGLYRLGFSGTAVEPNLKIKKLWRIIRPRDKFLAVGCGSGKVGEFHVFDDLAASNTFDKNFAVQIETLQGQKVIRTLKVPLMTLEEIIDEHLKTFPKPFLLDIDIEGLDFEVISNFNFQVNKRPAIILIEDIDPTNKSPQRNRISNLLNSHGYNLAARTVATSLYIDSKFLIKS